MSLIDPLLKFTERQPGTVVAALLGVILVGSIGGGLWISNLQSALELKEAMVDERIELEHQRNLAALAAVRTKNLTLEQQIAILRDSLERFAPAVDQASAALEAMSKSEGMDPEQLEQLEVARTTVLNLQDQHREIVRSLREAERVAHLLGQMAMRQLQPDATPTPVLSFDSRPQSPIFSAGILLVASLMLLGGAYALFRFGRWAYRRVNRPSP